VLNSQLENKPMQSSVLQRAEKVSSRAAKAGHTHELRSELAALYTLHQEMFEAIEHIRLNHYHSDEVVKSLKLLARSLPSKGEAPYLLVHMHGTQTLELMIRCVSNIDEEVLSHACLACHALIQRSPPARILFLRKQGIAELAECLRDYNTDVKATSLRILCLLAAESAHARDEMRTEEVLLQVLRTIQAYPADDVTLPVLDAALEAVAHIVLSSRTNQDYIRSVAGLEPLATALKHCVTSLPRHSPPAHVTRGADGLDGMGGHMGAAGGAVMGSAVMGARRGRAGIHGTPTRVEPAATCGAPSAVTAAQSRPTTAGRSRPTTAGRVRGERASDEISGKISGPDGRSVRTTTAVAPSGAIDLWKVTETACDALNNVAYRNVGNQEALLELGVLPACLSLLARHESGDGGEGVGASLAAGALNLLINMADTNSATQDALGSREAAEAVHRLLSATGAPRIVCAACLLLSHVAWNHPTNQRLYGTEAAIRTLLSLLSAEGRAAALGQKRADAAAAEGLAAVEGLAPGSAEGGAEAVGQAVELALYAMMALVNLSYCNATVQELVRACGGVPLLHQQLASPLYEARKTAAFCLGNLVRDNSANARDVVLHGGIESLLYCLNDDDDDELSKTAYSTILHLGDSGVQQLLHLSRDAAKQLADLHARTPDLKAALAAAMAADEDEDEDEEDETDEASAGAPGICGARAGTPSTASGAASGARDGADKLLMEDIEDDIETLSLNGLIARHAPAPATSQHQQQQQQQQQQQHQPTRRPASAAVGGGSFFAARAEGGGTSGVRDGAVPTALRPSTGRRSGAAAAAGAGALSSVPTETLVTCRTAIALLERCLPVLNGTVYTAEAHQRALLTEHGMDCLLPLLCDAVPFNLQEQTLYVLLNATSLKDGKALSLACRHGAVGAILAVATVAHGIKHEDALGKCLSVLEHLVEGSREGREKFCATEDGTKLLMTILQAGDVQALNPEVRTGSANLLLALVSAEPSQKAVLRLGGRRVLEQIALWDTKRRDTMVLAARAKQALRELTE
jgi:hypothetical protein